MKAYNNLTDLAVGIGKKDYEVIAAWKNCLGRGYMNIGYVEVMAHTRGNEMHFVVFNSQDSKDCKEYMMDYEIHEYTWKVYVDDIEGWQNCKVIDIDNTRLGINRATVKCDSGTQLNRRVKFTSYEDEFVADGCIYFTERD